MPSFDVVSRINYQEFDNALANCLREIGTRYDFKGLNISIERKDKTIPYYDGYDYTKWDRTDYIANKYNRIVLYRGNLYHASLDYFGDSLENSRLFQTFFFNTEY